ncbi:transglycosylase domain-containing protein [Microbacter sp. GSS18]|nr:transglycosylase domain-containing protein [Microbacter sp. GSS18]
MPDTKRTASGVLGGLAGLVGLSAVAGVLISATVTPAIAVSGAAASSAITMFDNLPSVLDIDKLMLPTTIYAKDEDGEWQELTQFYDQNRSPVEFDEITPVMYDAILSSEDPRYYEHGGVDLIGTTRAVLSNLRGGGETQGGSSISQQYVKNILVQRCEATAESDEERYNCWFEATRSDGSDGIQRKLQEMRYAIALEQKYSKDEILLGYLNIANFGGTTYGIDAAAQYYFGVSAADLNVAQAATLAGIVQNPNTYRIDRTGGSITDSEGNPVNGAEDGYALTKQRQQYVLGRMLDDGKITQEQFDEVYEAPIEPKITQPKTGCAEAGGAEYFCQYVRYVIERDDAFGATPDERTEALRRGGLNVYTTLNWELQKSAQATVSNYAPASIGDTPFGAASVSVEAETGRIVSITQNTKFDETASGDAGASSIVYAGDADFGQSIGFEAGSTFKLFTLIDWLEKGHSVNEVLNGRLHVFERIPNSCDGDWVNFGGDLINNFARAPGYVGTPMQFTRDSLNTGYFAMAEQLDLCDIKKVATKMGVTQGNGDEVDMRTLSSIIGTNSVSPVSMAAAYATVANNGIYCEPRAIERVTDSEGNEWTLPERDCTQVLDPAVAATAAYALQGVMNGGTGAAGNPYDGVPVIGKTGTHESKQTWLMEASTKIATATWVGNPSENIDLFQTWTDAGLRLSDLRYSIGREVQGKANQIWGGDAFPSPDSQLTRQVLTDLPNVVGRSIEDATDILQRAGFSVTVGDPVDSSEREGVVASQNPGPGRVAGGTVVTIRPSNGQGVEVPDVVGERLDRAMNQLRRAGFGNVQQGSCVEDPNANNQGSVTSTSPGAGSVVNQNTQITVDYALVSCGGGDGGTGDGGSVGGPGNSGGGGGNG